MNIAKSERKEGTGNFKRIGLAEWKVVAVNPSKEELETLLGIELDKDIEYLGENKEGDVRITLNFWLEDVKSGMKLPLRFSVVNKERVSQSGKPQWLNSTGGTSFCDEKENLPTWFTDFTAKDKSSIGKKVVREALIGEEELYNFLRAWIQADYFNTDTNILLDNKKLFKGNTKEIKDLITTDLVAPVVAMAIVKVVDSDSGVKEYNQISTKAFLPQYKMRMINNSLSTGKWTDKGCISFKEAFEGEYGEKGVYSISSLEEYVPGQHLVSTNNTIEHTDATVNDTEY